MVKENLAHNTSGYLGRRDNQLAGKLSDSPALSHSQQSSPELKKVEPLEIEAKAAEEFKQCEGSGQGQISILDGSIRS